MRELPHAQSFSVEAGDDAVGLLANISALLNSFDDEPVLLSIAVHFDLGEGRDGYRATVTLES